MAVNTCDTFTPHALDFFMDLNRRLKITTGGSMAWEYVIQWITVVKLRENTTSALGSGGSKRGFTALLTVKVVKVFKSKGLPESEAMANAVVSQQRDVKNIRPYSLPLP